MADMQSLVQAFRDLNIGNGSIGSPTVNAIPAMPIGNADPKAQLMQLLSGTPVPTSGGNGNILQAITQAIGNDPRERFADQMPNDAGSVPVRGGNNYNAGAEPMGMAGPATDGDLTQMLNVSDKVRRDLPPAQRDEYTGEDDNQKNRPMTTEEELEDVQKRMGEKGNEAPPEEAIKALREGRLSPMEFDKKYGEGSADDVLDAQDEA